MNRILRSALGASLLALAAVALCAVAGCGSSREPEAQRPREFRVYRVGPEDVLEIAVWKEPELSTVAPVRPDGTITVPLAGELRAAGRTTRDLEREIAARLARRIATPVVTVGIKEIHSTRIYVIGEVGRPGAYPLRGAVNVLEALALAGGLTEFADEDDIVILRRAGTQDGDTIRLHVDYDEAVDGKGLYELEPGDTVVVR
jgi:polysaccharide export outer membrane protein